MPLSTVFQIYHSDSSHYSCLSCVSPVLGWALKCLAQGHSHKKIPEDPVRLKPRTPELQVKHFTTEPSGTHDQLVNRWHSTVFTKDKILDCNKLKAFADNTINAIEKIRNDLG